MYCVFIDWILYSEKGHRGTVGLRLAANAMVVGSILIEEIHFLFSMFQ